MSERAPIQPQPVDLPQTAVPTNVQVTAVDAEIAAASWDQAMEPEYEGLLDATPEG